MRQGVKKLLFSKTDTTIYNLNYISLNQLSFYQILKHKPLSTGKEQHNALSTHNSIKTVFDGLVFKGNMKSLVHESKGLAYSRRNTRRVLLNSSLLCRWYPTQEGSVSAAVAVWYSHITKTIIADSSWNAKCTWRSGKKWKLTFHFLFIKEKARHISTSSLPTSSVW